MKKANINLLENYLLTEKKRKNTSKSGLNFIAIFLISVLLLSAYGLKLFLEDAGLKDTNQQLQSYVTDPAILKQVSDITVKQRQLTDLNTILVDIKSLNTVFDAMPELGSVVLGKIYACIPPDTSILNLSFDGQWMTLETVSSNYIRPSEFARNLRNTNFFEEVSYYGYKNEVSRFYGTIMIAMKVGK
jgi:Tfp pilus assembly protein PilN